MEIHNINESKEEFLDKFKKELFYILGEGTGVMVLNMKMTEEQLLDNLHSLDTNTIGIEFFQAMENKFVIEEAYELANIVKNHIIYNFTNKWTKGR